MINEEEKEGRTEHTGLSGQAARKSSLLLTEYVWKSEYLWTGSGGDIYIYFLKQNCILETQ